MTGVPSLVLAFAVAMLGTASTAGVAPAYQGVAIDLTRLEPLDCTRAGFSIPAPSNAVCGWITLPEDSAQTDNGRTVRIGVAVARATGANPQPDPIVFLQGGPGLSIVESAAAAAQSAFAMAVQARDLVVIDQRGTGLSEPRFDCPEVVAFEHAAIALPTYDQPGFAASVGACIDRLRSEDIDLSTYTSRPASASASICSLETARRRPPATPSMAICARPCATSWRLSVHDLSHWKSMRLGRSCTPRQTPVPAGCAA